MADAIRHARRTPEWALRIVRLRKQLGLSQAAFGHRLHYSPIAVSRWERGEKEPTAKCWIQVGNLAGNPDCWWFWSRAGLKRMDILRVLPERRGVTRVKQRDFDVVVAGAGNAHFIPKKKIELVAAPVLPIRTATTGELGDKEPEMERIAPEGMIAVPNTGCPNPADTIGLRVKGHSMSPLIHDGDIVVVDTAQTDSTELDGKIVIVSHKEHGLTLGRFRRFDGTELLESEDRAHNPVAFGKDRDWRIFGKVLWWLHQAP